MRDSSSRPAQASAGGAGGDRRVQRNRTALISAITDMTLTQGYSGLTSNDVAIRADVGRSTFYSHFSGLDDLLAQSLERHLSTLAACTLKQDIDPMLVALTTHFWTQRAAARTILRGEAAAAISRSLVSKLEPELLALRRAQRSRLALPVSLIATQLASGQLAVLDAWLSGRASASAEQVARLLQTTTYAAATAAV